MPVKNYKYKPDQGKGSHRRSGADDVAYRNGHDRIFGNEDPPRTKLVPLVCPHRAGKLCLRQENCEAMLRCLYPPKT